MHPSQWEWKIWTKQEAKKRSCAVWFGTWLVGKGAEGWPYLFEIINNNLKWVDDLAGAQNSKQSVAHTDKFVRNSTVIPGISGLGPKGKFMLIGSGKIWLNWCHIFWRAFDSLLCCITFLVCVRALWPSILLGWITYGWKWYIWAVLKLAKITSVFKQI